MVSKFQQLIVGICRAIGSMRLKFFPVLLPLPNKYLCDKYSFMFQYSVYFRYALMQGEHCDTIAIDDFVSIKLTQSLCES